MDSDAYVSVVFSYLILNNIIDTLSCKFVILKLMYNLKLFKGMEV